MSKQLQASKQRKSLLKLIDKYYADLADYARQNVLFEMGTRHASHRLMADAGKPHGWMLIAEQEKKVGGRTIRPDGTFGPAPLGQSEACPEAALIGASLRQPRHRWRWSGLETEGSKQARRI